jgi:S-adenosyl methyltransferase
MRDFDVTVPHSARVLDYFLGGKDHFAADREAGDRAIAAFPQLVNGVRANRDFLARAVRFLVGEAGIRQFLDIGTGIPTANNTHEVAQRSSAESRIVYVDNDPIVLAHAQALLASSPEGACAYLGTDLRNPDAVLTGAAETLDFSKPVAIMLLSVMHFVTDDDQAAAIVRRLMAQCPPGSALTISHPASDLGPPELREVFHVLNSSGGPERAVLRDHAQVERFFDGLDLVPPGLVNGWQWRPEDEALATRDGVAFWAGVGRKA